MNASEQSTRRIVTAGLLLAITLLLTLTRIGLIPVPTPAANATISHIPAIIGGILEGPIVGLVVGLGFGFSSFAAATVPMFKDPMVAILPRMFIGLASAGTFLALRRANKPAIQVLLAVLLVVLLIFSYQTFTTIRWLGVAVAVAAIAMAGFLYWWMQREDTRVVSLAIAAAVGSLTNTVLVLSMAVVRDYIPAEAAWGIGLTHGIPEVIVSAVVTVAVVSALRQVGRRQRSRL